MGRWLRALSLLWVVGALACGGDDGGAGEADGPGGGSGASADGAQGDDGALGDDGGRSADGSAAADGASSSAADGDGDTSAAGSGGSGGDASGAGPRDPADYPVLSELDCAGEWPEAWGEVEQAVLDGISALRAAGASCGVEGDFGPASALELDTALQQAARCQASYMAQQGALEQRNADGHDWQQRGAAAGYSGFIGGWIVTAVAGDAADIVERISADDTNCKTLLNADAVDVGIGVAPGGGRYYVEVTTAIP